MATTEQGELISLSASELATLLTTRQVSAREAVAAHIERIQSLDDKLHAVVVPLFDQALAEAEQADRINPEGRPLHGVPVTIKESYDIRGTASTLGVTGRRSLVASSDAALVARLREAGAIVVGKTNVPQLLIYVEADNPLYGRTNNPWNLDRTPGGSSGGEGAALAAGYSALGLGTDIGGSLRIPAHFCGIHSLKPTPDRLSLDGMVAEPLFRFSGIRDAAGPLARSVSDLYVAMAALGSPVPQVSIKGLRIGFYEDDGYVPASKAIVRAVREASNALASARCILEPFQVPNIGDVLHAFYGLLTLDGGRNARAFVEDSAYDPRIKDLLQLASLPNPVRPLVAGIYRMRGQRRLAQLVGWAGRQSEHGTARLLAAREAAGQKFLQAMDQLDVLIGPPCALPAFTHGATRYLGAASVSYTLLYNLLAWPAGVVSASRVRKDEEGGRPSSRDRVEETARHVDRGSVGLPVGVQVTARPGREDLVLAVMSELEAYFRGQPDYPATPITPA